MFCNDSVHKDALLVSATEVRLCARIGPSLYGSVQFMSWQIVGSLCFVLILTCVLLGLHTFESLLLIETDLLILIGVHVPVNSWHSYSSGLTASVSSVSFIVYIGLSVCLSRPAFLGQHHPFLVLAN